MNVGDMLQTHPKKPTNTMDAVTACIKACYACSESCTICADACLGEDRIDNLRRCIRLNLDCAAICQVTGQLSARQTETDIAMLGKQLETCAAACASCAEECEKHAGMHDHCKLCTESCRACERACNDLMAVL